MMAPRPLHVLLLTSMLIGVAFGRDGNLRSVTSPARLPGDGAALPDKGRLEVTPTVILGRTGVPVEVTHEVTGSSVDGVLSVSAGDGTTARFRVTTSDLAPDGVTEGPGRCQVSLEDEGVSDGTTGAPFTQSDPSGQDEALGGDPTAGVTSYTPMTSQESAPWLEGVTSSRHDLKCTLTRTHTAFTLQHTYLHPGRYDLLARFQDTHAPSYWEVVAEVVVKELLEITLGPAKVLALGAEGAAAHAHISLTPILDTRRPPTDHEDFTAQPATHLSPPATHLSPPTRAHEAFTPPGRTSGGSDAAGPLAPTPAPQPFLAGGPSPAHDPQLCPGGVLSWAWSFGDDTGPDTKTDSRRREEMETHEDARVMKEGEDERMAGIIKTEGRESGGGRHGRGRQGGLITGANGIAEDRGASGDAGAKASAAAREELKERENIEKAKAKGAPPEAEDDTTASTSTTATSSSSSSSNTHGPDTSSPAPSSTTVHHTYHKPGLYNFSAQVLCDGRPRWRKPVAGAFLVAVPIRGVEISVAERDVVLPLLPFGLREERTRNVSINISVAEGSHLDPLALELEDGVELFSRPDVDARNGGGWVAEFLCNWRRPGRYRPRVRVSNPLGSETVSLRTSILVQSIPQAVVLMRPVAEVGQEVVFHALSNGTDVRYDWTLPRGEVLHDAGAEVRRVYNTSLTDIVKVTAYNDALASRGRRHYPQDEAIVVVQYRLEAVTIAVEGSVGPDGRVIIPMGKLTSLTATVTPPEAAHDVTFHWVMDSKNASSWLPSFSYVFNRKGERELSVLAENRVSSVKSSASLLVVEPISGLRGVAFQGSVHAGSPRTYTLQVDHGSNITYVWDFGDGSEPLRTDRGAVEHVYNQTGAYDLSVSLTTPLQDSAVAATTVFVLQSGICDTPKIYGFFPKDQTEYDGTQEILVEPVIHRNCSAGGGPEYRWRVLDEDGHEALLTSYHAFFSPTLVIHPFYDNHWTRLLTPSAGNASDVRPSALDPLSASSNSPFAVLADGTYTAELTVAEKGTIVSASANASFSVVAIRLKVAFTDGSAREVDARSNITLRVEVTSPTPDYDIEWGCHLLYSAGERCFPEADPWSKYTNTSDHADTVFDILHRWWELIHGHGGGGNRSAGDGRPADAAPSGSGRDGARLAPDPGVIKRYYRFEQTITFPAADLRLDPADASRSFLFNVTVSYQLRRASAEQLITVAVGRDNFGIRVQRGAQIPFGAYRKLVFESECRTCSAEELRDMKYKWNLQMMTSSGTFGSSRPPSVDEEEERILEALRQGRPKETFLPRPRDYLRVYKSDLLLQLDEGGERRPFAASFPPPDAKEISASDLKKFPASLSRDLLDRARRIMREDGSVDRAAWRSLRLELRGEVWKDTAKQGEEGRSKRDAQEGDRHAPPPPATQQDLEQKSRSRRSVDPWAQEGRLQLAQLHRQPLPLGGEGHGDRKPSGGHEGRTRGGDRGRGGDEEREMRDYDYLAGEGTPPWPRDPAEAPRHAAPGRVGKTAGGARTKPVLAEEPAGGRGSGERLEEEEDGHEAGEDPGGGGGAPTERIHSREHQGRDALDTGSTRRRKNSFETSLVRDESGVKASSPWSASPDDDDEGENASGNSGSKETTGAAVTPDAGPGGGVTPSVTQVRRMAPGESVAGSVTPDAVPRDAVTTDAGQASVVDTEQEEAAAALASGEPPETLLRSGSAGEGSPGSGEDPRRVVLGAGRGEGPGRSLRSSPASPSPRDETAEHRARGASPTPALSPSNALDADVGKSGAASASAGAAATTSGVSPQDEPGPPAAPSGPPSAPSPPLPAALSAAGSGEGEQISPSINEHSSKEDEWTRPLPAAPSRRSALNREEREKKGGEKLDEGEGEGHRKQVARGDTDVSKAKGRKERGEGGGDEQGPRKTRKRKRRGREPAPPSGRGRGGGADSEGGGRGARDDGHDGPTDADVGREARRPPRPAHPGHDSAYLPIRLPAPRPQPPAWPADAATAGSRPVSPPGKRRGARDGGGGGGRRLPTPLQRAWGQSRQGAGGAAGDASEWRDASRPPQRSPAEGEPVSVYPPMSWLSGLSAGRGVPHDAPLASYPPLPTASPSSPQVLDYQKHLQMKHLQAQSPEHRMAPFATTSGPDQSVPDGRRKPAWWGGGGGGHPQGREAGGDTPSDAGGWARTPTPREGDAVASPFYPRETRRKSAPRGYGGRGGRDRGERRGRGRGRDQDNALPTDDRPAAATSAPARGDPERPPAWAMGAVAEGQRPSPRGAGFQGSVKEFAEETNSVPDWNCPSDLWRECVGRTNSKNRTQVTLTDTLGEGGEDHVMREEGRPPATHKLENVRFTDVVWFTTMTSTGTRGPELVVYMNMLYTDLSYKLSLLTQNPRTNNSGSAQQLIDFSEPPELKSCRVRARGGGTARFWATCESASALYQPLYVQWSYHFLRYGGTKTLFYHGARRNFDFTLPSGLESNDNKIYVSVKAVDGKGVASKYQEVTGGLQVKPRSESGDGVLSLFKEISRLENESPPLLLQEVRSLAWELNLLETTQVTQTVFDNIVALLFYQTRCKDSMETVTDPTDESVAAANSGGAGILSKVNLLKSCARDHLVELVASLPVRDEMEVMQVLTALEVVVDANEFISSKTFTRVIEAMRAAQRRMWWNYNPEIRTQAAKEYFVLTSEVLDKQTEIYDWASSSLLLSSELVELLLKVMENEIRMRFLNEQPLSYSSSTLKYTGYLAETDDLNRWSNSVLFAFNTSSLPRGVHLVQSLEHKRSPFYFKDDLIVSEVVNVDLHKNILKSVTVKLPRSKLATDVEYDFRRPGILSPQSLTAYEFEVKDEHAALAFHVLLQVVRVLNTDYPVAAVVLICQNLQSLREPLYKEELQATLEPSQVQLSLEPGQLSKGPKLLIIMDKNSYEHNWSHHNESVQGADFLVAAWWSQCLSWNNTAWSHKDCAVEGNLSTWDLTTCSCHTTHSIYGAHTVPILSKESTVAVNDLMLVETYMALYFIVLVLVLYFVLALGLQTSERHRLKRRNIWLRDNDPGHEWAYLLTIKTGTQWNAGTTSKVYAIVHGTHGMSETRELQSKQTGQLFTRGALCTFILTTAEPLGDILKVQLWHDNSGGRSAGWYVCETSVVDLVLGARYAYPCYRWLAVQAEDAKVEREITLESPTTFFQDFEHFLPQYASEHMLWTSLLTTSSTAKFYRLQRLTICLIVCLCLGTISLAVVQRINTEHTMMVPDMHIEPMYYGCIIAMALLPVQWLLEMVFKMSNRLEEKEYNNKSVLDTLRATRESGAAPPPRGDGDGDGESDAGLSDEESELYNPNSSTWTALARWAQTVELTNAHLSLLQDKDMDGMHVTQRSRTPNAAPSEGPPEEALGPADPAARCAEGKARPLPAGGGRDAAKKCSPTIFEFLAELRRAFACLVRILLEGRRARCKGRARQEDEAGWEADEDEDEDDEGEGGEGRAASSLTFIFSQCVGWIVCCFFAAMCCMVLVVRGSRMPMDYCAVWLHIIYMTLCFSMFVMQPLVVVIYTLYKVCMYRWLGCRGCISDCVTVPLDQVVAIWNRYQTVLRGYKERSEDMSNEKLLEERQRTRDLRFAHPPGEDYLLRCREKEAQRDKVSSLFQSVLGLVLMLALLLVIASNSNVSERYMLNASTLTALENGSCLDREKYQGSCHAPYGEACNLTENEDYMRFRSIVTKEDWWKWASSELIALAYNADRAFSQFGVFCDSSSVLIGRPRIRKYDINPEECEAAKYLVTSNRSLADLLHVQSCFPEYVDNVSHVFSFGSNQNKEYQWDAHFLAVNYGKFSQYSYTEHQQDLPSSPAFAVFLLILLEASHWINEQATRAVVTEMTLYHPQTDLYTAINLLAEFPSLSGAQVTVRVSSTAVERYRGTWSLVCIMAEVVLVAVSMHYLYRTTIYVYKCRLKVWKSFWGFLDILMTILSWSYIVSLMLRVHIAEYIMWQLRVAYFQKYVSLKSLTTWDNILESLVGGMLLVHMIRCMRMMRYLSVFRRLGHVLNGAAKDVLVVTVMLLGLLVCCMLLGYLWFSSLLWEFHTVLEAFLSLVRIILTHVPFIPNLESKTNGYITSLGYLYYLLTYVLLYQLTKALYKAAFIHAMKSYVAIPGVDVAWRDIKVYAKERFQSFLRFIQRKEEVVDEPKDNTPPDFYMAELELQINQILGGLDNLAESLGIVTERVAELDEDEDDEDDEEESRDSHGDGDDDADEEEQPFPDRGRDWLAEGFLQGKVKSSTPKTELDVILQPLQKKVQELLDQAESGEREPFAGAGAADDRLAEAESAQDSPFETSFNLDAFTDIASCQTEIEAITRSWNLSALPGDPAARTWAQDDGGQLAKFLKDVSVSAASDESLQAFGKYGKTVGKLKAVPRLQPSHESLAAALRSHSTSAASDASRIRSVSSFADNGGGQQEQAGGRPRSHTSAAAAAQQEGQAHGSSVAMLGSRLRRTQTQGRGKGHVDVLDIESLILDSEEGSEY